MVCGGCSQYRLRLETWEGRRHGNLGCFVHFSTVVNRAKMASYFHYRVSILLLNCPQDKTQTQLTQENQRISTTHHNEIRLDGEPDTISQKPNSMHPEKEERKTRTDKNKKKNEPLGDMSSTCRYAPSWLQIGAFTRAVWYLLIKSV